MRKVNIGIVGLGTVGGGVYTQILKKSSLIRKRRGVSLNVKYVCDKSGKVLKDLNVPKDKIAKSYTDILSDSEVDIVVELVGGCGIAKKMVLDSLSAGKDVVTANKALLSECGDEIFGAAEKYGRKIMFEAAVGGGIPVIKSVREALVANNVRAIFSIINGTCNYILSKMARDNIPFDTALKIAQEKGYAEADPTLDIEGIDSAHKITLLAELAWGKRVRFGDISCEGISKIQQGDIAFASQLGYVIKLLALAKKSGSCIEIRVQPTLLKKSHILANVDDSYNAVYIMCDDVENLLFYGRGAGRMPTASAVVSDIVDLAVGNNCGFNLSDKYISIKNISSILSRYYLRFIVLDKPGVLAKIADILGKEGVSISDVMQQDIRIEKGVPLVLLTHHTAESRIVKAVEKIKKLPVMAGDTQVLRMEE